MKRLHNQSLRTQEPNQPLEKFGSRDVQFPCFIHRRLRSAFRRVRFAHIGLMNTARVQNGALGAGGLSEPSLELKPSIWRGLVNCYISNHLTVIPRTSKK